MPAASKASTLRIRLSPQGPGALLAAVLLTLASTLLALWLPRYLGMLVDVLVSGDWTPSDLARRAAIYLGVALLGAVASKLMRQVPMRLGPRIAHNLRMDLLRHLMRLDDAQVRRHPVGDLMSRLGSDVQAVSEMAAHGGHSLLRAAFTLGLAFAVMSQRSAPLTLLMAVLLPLMILVGYLLLRSIQNRYLAVQEQLGLISSYCQESFQGIRVVKGMGLEARRSEVFSGINREFISRNMRLSRIEVPAWPFMHFGFALGNVGLLLAGGRLVIANELTLGTLVEFQQYLMVLQWPTLSLAWTMSLVLRGRTSLRRLRSVTGETPTLEDGEHTRAAIERLDGGLSFEHVSLTLDDRRILHDISFSLPKGGLLGITGPTGSGKTMLLNLLLRRFEADAGRITLGGHPLRDIPAERLYRAVRIAPQEPTLFSLTLEENLRIAKPDATAEELARALRVSALDQDVAEWPDGLRTRIGERGVTLSGGQRQRCAIARAVLGQAEWLALDDSLSAVDTATEARILAQILPILRERGGILVSHRYSTLRHCDQVLVLREGAIEAEGSPAELIARPGFFAELAERQHLREQLEALRD